jgi:hypothetical protein
MGFFARLFKKEETPEERETYRKALTQAIGDLIDAEAKFTVELQKAEKEKNGTTRVSAENYPIYLSSLSVTDISGCPDEFRDKWRMYLLVISELAATSARSLRNWQQMNNDNMVRMLPEISACGRKISVIRQRQDSLLQELLLYMERYDIMQQTMMYSMQKNMPPGIEIVRRK